ncbi:hypothetical protein G9A89_021428 [Geosiphon pyriformis]|nr:hypothetical protein G9A89_021428 [Geosiphon pyriformis]
METTTLYSTQIQRLQQETFINGSISRKWDNTPCLTCGDILPEECNWIDVAIRGGVCDQTCQYALSISEKVRRGTPFNAAYNNAFNKLYHYPHNAEMIFDLAMALINRATQEDCLECYALSIPLPDENDENEIEFGVSELVEELPTIPIYLLKKQPPLQLKYFDNHGQGIRPEKAHKIDAGVTVAINSDLKVLYLKISVKVLCIMDRDSMVIVLSVAFQNRSFVNFFLSLMAGIPPGKLSSIECFTLIPGSFTSYVYPDISAPCINPQ